MACHLSSRNLPVGRRSGTELTRLPNLKAEVGFIANRLRQLHKEGRAWNEMAVIYRTKFVAEEAIAALAAARHCPAEWVTQNSPVRAMRRPATP